MDLLRHGVLPAVMLLGGTFGVAAQELGTATVKLGDTAIEGNVSCVIDEKLEILTPDGGRADNDGDGFAMLLRGENGKGFVFTITLEDQVYTGFAQGGLVGDKLLIDAPKLVYLDGNGTVPTYIEVNCP